MKIIKPDVQFITPIDGATILKRLEQCGRVCYKSEDKITEGSAGNSPTIHFHLLAQGVFIPKTRLDHRDFLVVMTANIREWRHFLKLRCSPAAHPQMREVALILLDKVHWLIPVCFDDIWSECHADV